MELDKCIDHGPSLGCTVHGVSEVALRRSEMKCKVIGLEQ